MFHGAQRIPRTVVSARFAWKGELICASSGPLWSRTIKWILKDAKDSDPMPDLIALGAVNDNEALPKERTYKRRLIFSHRQSQETTFLLGHAELDCSTPSQRRHRYTKSREDSTHRRHRE
jgi:hypothetical protein